MSTTIDVENLKAVRKPFDVICGIDAERTTATNTVAYDADYVGMTDTNAVDAVKSSAWNPLALADLSGGGFPLDDGVVFPVTSHTASASGKYGLRSYAGGMLEIDVTTSASVISITCEGTGTLTVNGAVYPLQNQFVIPVRANVQETLLFESSDAHARVVVYTIVPGIVLQFENDSIVSCVLDLAGNLSLKEPSFEVSTIELNAYYPFDISDIISTMPDNTPLWYKAGYPGDYCETRHFYLDGEATMKDRVITIKGTDASGRFEGKTVRSKWFNNPFELYTYVYKKAIEDAGVTLTHYQSKPTDTSSTYIAITTEQDVQGLIGDMMVSCHATPIYFWPTFVDAGIPTLYYKQDSEDGTTRSPFQLRVWDIREEDCADVERNVSRKISSVWSSDGESPLLYNVQAQSTQTTIESKSVVAGEIVEVSYDGYFYQAAINNAKPGETYYLSCNGAKWTANVTGTASLSAKLLNLLPVSPFDAPTPSQVGERLYQDMVILGYVYESYTGSVPTNSQRFNASNVTGSFTFRGDPRMQPRDTFRFTRLDGTVEVATIERIEMTHEGGGTTAEIHYRLGVV